MSREIGKIELMMVAEATGPRFGVYLSIQKNLKRNGVYLKGVRKFGGLIDVHEIDKADSSLKEKIGGPSVAT